jgi:VanZ family protein
MMGRENRTPAIFHTWDYRGRFVRLWLPAISWYLIILFLSSLPQKQPITGILHLDKIFHLLEYGIFGFLLARPFHISFSKAGSWTYLLVILAATLLGIVDEIYQLTVPTRFSSGFDALFDSFGSCLGCMVYKIRSYKAR